MANPISTDQAQRRSLTSISVATGALNSVSSPPTDAIVISPTANAAAANVMTITNASLGQASTITIPDPGMATGNISVNAGAGGGFCATVTLTAAQVIAAYATPILLVPAPGTGKCIFVVNAFVSTHYDGTTAFATGTAPIIQYGSTAHGAGTIATAAGLVTGDIEATADQTRNLFGIATAAKTGVSGLGLYFSSTAAYTAGGAGTVSFTIDYVVVQSAN